MSLRRGTAPRTDTLATATRVLPRTGRPGEAPPWPLGPRPAKRIAETWASLWRLPQAVVWEEQAGERMVARYCRCLTQAEAAKPSAAILAEVRQLEDRLGLSPMSMLRLRWSIGDVEETTDGDHDAEVLELSAYYDDLYAEVEAMADPGLDEETPLE